VLLFSLQLIRIRYNWNCLVCDRCLQHCLVYAAGLGCAVQAVKKPCRMALHCILYSIAHVCQSTSYVPVNMRSQLNSIILWSVFRSSLAVYIYSRRGEGERQIYDDARSRSMHADVHTVSLSFVPPAFSLTIHRGHLWYVVVTFGGLSLEQ